MIVKSPYKKGRLCLDNRLVMASLNCHKAGEDGKVTKETIEWYRERGKGLGMVILEHSAVSRWDRPTDRVLCIDEDSDIPGLCLLTDALHREGTRVQIQLDHGGGWLSSELRWKEQAQKRVTDELTDEQLSQVVRDFAEAAVRAEKAGFDGVQIKACHFYMLAQFYSPLTNHRRSGRYAGTTFESRFQLILDVIQAVRRAVSADLAVSVRFPIEDFDPAGCTVEECIRAAAIMKEQGVDLLDLSGGPKYSYVHPYSKEPGWFGDSARRVRESVDIPLLITGGIRTVRQAEDILAAGKADLIGVGRAVMEDEQWGRKAIHGE